MADYCLDTSGLSNPLENLPEDIFGSLWRQVEAVIRSGRICCNTEILEELGFIQGRMGACIEECKDLICLEIGTGDWPWQDYLAIAEQLRTKHQAVISEYNGNRKRTVGLNDISIIALAMTLDLPLISMEKANTLQKSREKMRIPDICVLEGVTHITFNDFLRLEGISL